MYAHMKNPPSVHEGERVWAGERVGEVGKTGNARTVGCQLHIEIHVTASRSTRSPKSSAGTPRPERQKTARFEMLAHTAYFEPRNGRRG